MDIYSITSQEILERISRHCPTALSTYLQIINRADRTGQVFFSKNLVTIDMSESWTKFKNNLRSLAKENLLIWGPDADFKGILVSLASIEEEDD